jgi:hypothetical protein
MWEDDVYGLLKKMHEDRIAVELCLTSNLGILNVRPEQHPFKLYWKAGVPLIINTDDEGVSRGNLTMEYVRAAQWFDLKYGHLKWLAYNSLEYSFLEGESLFEDGDFNRPKTVVPINSKKAEAQKYLISAFVDFEKQMLDNIQYWDKENLMK